MKRIFIIRHAKSSWDDPRLKDVDRPLNKRGEKDAPLMAKVFKKAYKSADSLISSPAVRALTTCKIFAEEMSYPQNAISIREEIYGASVDSMLAMINRFDNKWDTVCLFGHNPTFTYLAEQLADVNIGNLPTAGIVGIEFGVEIWAAVSLGSGEQFYYDYPKNHK